MEMAFFYSCGAVDTYALIWIGVVLGVLFVILLLGFFLIRRFTVSSKPDNATETAFTLEQIRKLHEQGRLSDEEFKNLKEKIIQKAQFL
jgi:uncharacterized membrane protein